MARSEPLTPNEINPAQNLLQIYRSQKNLMLRVCLITVIGLYLLSLVSGLVASLQDPTIRAQFTMLMALHLGLHLVSGRIERRQRLAIIYVFTQLILLFYIGVLVKFPLTVTFMPLLIGEVAVIFETMWLIPFVILVGMVLAVTNNLIILFPLLGNYSADIVSAVGPFLIANLFSVILGIWTSVPLFAAYYLVVRARRQTGGLLVKLDIAHHQLAEYAEQVEQLTVATERARMARELHDTLAQGVAGLILQLEALDAQFKRGNHDSVAATLLEIKERARATLKGSRQAIDDLRLTTNQPGMLVSTINEEVRKFTALTGVPCAVEAPPYLTLPTSTTEHTIRFVSEGLANVAKHAKASQVNIRLDAQEKEAVLEIQDNGVGFDPAAAAQKNGHYGLLGLQERARLVDGKFEIESVPNNGTTIRLRLPKRN